MELSSFTLSNAAWSLDIDFAKFMRRGAMANDIEFSAMKASVVISACEVLSERGTRGCTTGDVAAVSLSDVDAFLVLKIENTLACSDDDEDAGVDG